LDCYNEVVSSRDEKGKNYRQTNIATPDFFLMEYKNLTSLLLITIIPFPNYICP
jgi:hypothetical protein